MILNLSIDDISPNEEFGEKVFVECQKFLDKYVNGKITLFLIMAYKKKNDKNVSYFYENEKFLQKVHSLPSENYQLAWHGYHHSLGNTSNNDEFKFLNKAEAEDLFEKMREVALKSDLLTKIKPVFRPPAFWINKLAAKGLSDCGITTFALSKLKHHILYYNTGKSDNFGLCSEQNPSVNWNFGKINYFDSMPPLIPLKKDNNINIVYHAGISSANFFKSNELCSFLEKCEDEIQFEFL